MNILGAARRRAGAGRHAPSGAGLVAVRAAVAPDGVTLAVCGDLDAATMPVLSRCLAQVTAGRPGRLVFDLAQVTFIDCAATRLIASAATLLPAGTRPIIRHPSPAVRRILALTDIATTCDLDP
ncbi:MAG TPA: STAS domain-containing protein [Streptosporangiaceae bacterium]|nr:STAS domain-containing protein [Streptosporangiaceae bacterium]